MFSVPGGFAALASRGAPSRRMSPWTHPVQPLSVQPLALRVYPSYTLSALGADAVAVAVFNTHAFVKRLTAAGMPEAQAEALADELTPLIDDRLATKDDLANLATKADLRAEIADAKPEINKWMFGTIGLQTIIVLGAVITLARVVP